MLDFAAKHNLHVKGHVLIWHVTSPPFFEDMTGEEVRECIRRHIFTTMGYFRGRIKMWDVVNESLASDGTLVENVFYRKMGPSYIEECFRMAHGETVRVKLNDLFAHVYRYANKNMSYSRGGS